MFLKMVLPNGYCFGSVQRTVSIQCSMWSSRNNDNRNWNEKDKTTIGLE